MKNAINDEKNRIERCIKNIKAVRTRNHMSQEKFAEEIGVTTNTISRIETGAVPLSSEVALKIKKRFHVSMDYLFGFSEYEQKPPCSKTCDKLIDAQYLIDMQSGTIHEMKEKLNAIQEILDGKKRIKLTRSNHS